MLLTAINVQLLKNIFTILLVLFCIYVLSLIIRGIVYFIQSRINNKQFKNGNVGAYTYIWCRSIFSKIMIYTHMIYTPYKRYLIYDNSINIPKVLLYVYLDLDDIKFFPVSEDLMANYNKERNAIFNNEYCISVKRSFITNPIDCNDKQYVKNISEAALGKDFMHNTFDGGRPAEYYKNMSKLFNGMMYTASSPLFIGVEEVDNHGHFLEDPTDKLQSSLDEQLARKFNELKRELDKNNEEE